MLKFLSLSCLVLSALTSAAAIPSDDDDKKAGECKQRGKERIYVAKYDDLPFTESPDNSTPIGNNYLALKYTNFYVVSRSPPPPSCLPSRLHATYIYFLAPTQTI